MASILITGATAGIGRAAAILLAGKGHRVFAAGRDEAALAELDTGYANITPLRMDVTDDDAVTTAAAQVREALGGEARARWEGFPASSRRGILWWIKSAKTAKTRSRRIAETARLAGLGLRANFPESKGR
jgi:NAD(P)-dependent dehydrogenase (short-subunit alcohol dehydrogenase family)